MTVMTGGPWTAVLDGAAREEALAVVRSIADPLRDGWRLAEVIARAHEQSPAADATAWRPTSLGGGLGLALAFGHLDRCFPEEGWLREAHGHLEAAARTLERQSDPDIALFDGLSGVGLTAAYLARGGPRYGRLLDTIDARVSQRASALAEAIRARTGGLPISVFDLVSGLSGAVAYLLLRADRPAPRAALQACVAALAGLAAVDERGMPAWHTPATRVSDDVAALRSQYAQGYLDCGLAHGAPGPLTVLAMARAAGLEAPGLDEAISHLAEWLLAHRHDDAWGVNWPSAIALEIDGAGRAAPVSPATSLGAGTARSGWCYGTPGVARALWQAGVALDAPRFTDAAIEAVRAMLRRPPEARRLDSPTMCHGLAGYLQCMLRFARASGLPEALEEARATASQLVAMREPEALLGYRAVELHGVRVDQPGLVDGACGVMAALLSAAVDVEPAWDRAFLLS